MQTDDGCGDAHIFVTIFSGCKLLSQSKSSNLANCICVLCVFGLRFMRCDAAGKRFKIWTSSTQNAGNRFFHEGTQSTHIFTQKLQGRDVIECSNVWWWYVMHSECVHVCAWMSVQTLILCVLVVYWISCLVFLRLTD